MPSSISAMLQWWRRAPRKMIWPQIAVALVLLYTCIHLYVGPEALGRFVGASSRSTALSTTSSLDTPASAFVQWLQANRHRPSRTLFVSLGNKRYVPSLENFKAQLSRWGYDRDFVVLCLDHACADYKGFKGSAYGGFVGESIAHTKFYSNLEMAQAGYNFVFLDADVFLTGSHDPLQWMRPVSDDTWDIQFQEDEEVWHGYKARLNIGWYWVKPTETSLDFLNRTIIRWKETNKWDQEIMNDLVLEMNKYHDQIRVNILDTWMYRNWMLWGFKNDWLFGFEDRMEKFIQESAVLHFTCVEQELKEYFGKEFGGWADLNKYYSRSPALLSVTNITGSRDTVHTQILLAARLAHATGRTLIWPHTVEMSILRWADNSPTSYFTRPKFPGVRAVSYGAAARAGINVVEGRYLENRRKYIRKDPTRVYVPVGDHFPLSEASPAGDVAVLQKRLANVPRNHMIVLDMSRLALGLPKPDGAYADFEVAQRAWKAAMDRNGVTAYTDALKEAIYQCPFLENQSRCWVCSEAPHPSVGLVGDLASE